MATKAQQRILQVLEDNRARGQMTAGEIRDELGARSRASITTALRNLCLSGEVEAVDPGGSDWYRERYYSLPEPARQISLSFYDHHRQRYDQWVPIDSAAKFMLGDYGDNTGGVGPGGEFKIALLALHGVNSLSPHLEVFGDAIGSLRAAIALGLLESLGDVDSADEFSRRLIALGIRDASDRPLELREEHHAV